MDGRPLVLVVLPDEDAVGHHRLALALRTLAAGNGLEGSAAGAGYEVQAFIAWLHELSFGLTASALLMEKREAGEVLDDEE